MDEKILLLKERALEITDLMGFVSLNMAAVRKILKKIAKNLHSDGPHGPGILSFWPSKGVFLHIRPSHNGQKGILASQNKPSLKLARPAHLINVCAHRKIQTNKSQHHFLQIDCALLKPYFCRLAYPPN